jgi:hypothetical protein
MWGYVGNFKLNLEKMEVDFSFSNGIIIYIYLIIEWKIRSDNVPVVLLWDLESCPILKSIFRFYINNSGQR